MEEEKSNITIPDVFWNHDQPLAFVRKGKMKILTGLHELTPKKAHEFGRWLLYWGKRLEEEKK